MKINRYRKVTRTLKFYSNNFGFRKPYQVLIDGTLCVAALRHKVNIHEQFSKYLGDVKLLTTECIVKEVESLGSATYKALFVLKNFGQHQCGHEESNVPASDCIMHMVESGNTSRYIVATQDRELQHKCRNIIGVPLLYFHLRVPTLEAPSVATVNAVSKKLAEAVCPKSIKKNLGSEEIEIEKSVKRKRKTKGGPNPLSCKKKKKQNGIIENTKSKVCKKTKRKHVPRFVKKIKEEIMASVNQ